MKNQHKFFIVSLILLCLMLSLVTVSADDLATVEEGDVSGDVDVVVENPGTTSGELNYEIPQDVENVEYAGLFVNVYSGSAATNYSAECNVSMTSNGETEQIASEELVSNEGSADGTVYTINDHTTKCYSDYQMIYNITDKVQGKTGTLTFNVTTGEMDGYKFDGRIKLIGLVFAYNDGDNDKVSYWVNSGQSWIKTGTSQSVFDVGALDNEVTEATIDNVALSSTDGNYAFNGEDLTDSLNSTSGSFLFKYHKWDVLSGLTNGTNTLVYAREGSFKNVLSVLKVKSSSSVSVKPNFTTEYTSAPTAYAGTNNILKLVLNNDGNLDANYAVDFYIDGVKVNSSEIAVAIGENGVLYFTDDTIRPITEATVNGADNAKVNYTAIIYDQSSGAILNETTLMASVLYNGNLGKDFAYPAETISPFNNITVNGGIIIETQDAATYSGAAITERTDVWTIDVPEGAQFINGFVYVAYNWDKTNGTIPVWITSFNNNTVAPVASYRDQSNLGTYGKYGYGLVVYDVSAYIRNGVNEFKLEKESGKTAVYPSTLVALYNVTDSDTTKTIYMYNGADLLANSNNLAGRTVASNSVLDISTRDDIVGAQLYVFAASAQKGESDIIVNDETYPDVWTGTSNTTDLYVIDLGVHPQDSNAVSFVATGSTILALQQFIVVESVAFTDIYVSPDGTGTGASADDPTTIYKALNKTTLQPFTKIHVLDGFYNLTARLNVTVNNTYIFAENPGNAIFSGRDSIICFRVSGANVTLDGLTLTHGKGTGGGAYFEVDAKDGHVVNCIFRDMNNTANGGALYIVSGCTNVYVEKSQFINITSTGSTGGGSIYLAGNDATITDCIFENNTATRDGGAIRVFKADNAKIINSNFTNCIASAGGAIACSGNNGSLVNCIFTDNAANSSYTTYSGANHTAGAVFWTGTYGIIDHCTFINNKAPLTTNTYGGGAILLGYDGSSYNCTIMNSIFINNSARNGGAILWATSIEGRIINCTFNNNRAENGSGGAINWRGDKSHILESDFNDNYAKDNGGAIFITSNVNNYLDLAECIFVNNSADGMNYTIHNNGELYLDSNTVHDANGEDSLFAIYNNGSILSPVIVYAVVNETDPLESNVAYYLINDTADIIVYIVDDNLNTINGPGLSLTIGETVITEFEMDDYAYKTSYKLTEFGTFNVNPSYTRADDPYIYSGTLVAGEAVHSAAVELVSEYNDTCYAGTENIIEVHITNDGAFNTNYTVDFYVDGVLMDSTELNLAVGFSNVLFLTDDTIRPVTEATVIGGDNEFANYTVIVSDKDSGEVLTECTITPPILYNGNLGKDFAYPAENISSFKNITFNGGIIIDTKDTYSSGSAPGRTDIWVIELDDEATLINGFIYVAYNWDKTEGNIPEWNCSFNEANITPVASYRDQSNLGKYGKYGYGLVVFDVSDLIKKGENTFSLSKIRDLTAVYPSTLVAIYNVSKSDNLKTIYMYNGADLLANTNNTAGRTVASNSILDIELVDNIVATNLFVFAGGAQAGEGDLIVNDVTYSNIWDGTSSSLNEYVVDLGTNPIESNTVSFVGTGSTILALQQFIIVSYNVPSVDAKLRSEYDGACYAGTENVLQLNLTNDGSLDTSYVVDFYVDGEKVNSTEVQLDSGAKTTVYLIDELIRPITADTVNGANNAKVNYTVIITDKDSGAVLDEITLNPTVWYNGNLGKDYAYPAETITSFNNITVNGDIIISTQEAGTYLGAGTTNRTDVWTLEVPEGAQFVNGFVYVAYNWDKTEGTIPVWTTTFNGESITPVASYRDQSNLGKYGKYGYGLVVYDVSGLLVNGDNTFVLEKIASLTAVYPSTLVALYNVTDSDSVKTIYMYNGADLLANTNNTAGRIAASNSVLSIDSVSNVIGSQLYIFAAGAQRGESDIIVNEDIYSDVWSGTSNTTDLYVIDLGTAPSETNAVSFIATGSTILALEQFIIVEYVVPSVDAKLGTEYSNVCFAGTNNVLQLNLTNDGSLDTTYIVDFYVDGEKVNSTEVQLISGAKTTLLLVDDIIRPVTADTVNGASTAAKVNYTVVIADKDSGNILDEKTLMPTVLYNGNLGKDLAYPAETITSFNNITVNGDIIISTQEAGTYLGATTTNRTDVWTLEVPEGAQFVNGFVYVAYNWDKTQGTIPVWTTTFNGETITPVASYRDQSNMGTYGKYGYGLVVYDVTGLLVSGDNTFVLEKAFNMTAVYPSTLVALYNVSESDTLKTIYMYNGADLLSNANNFLGRTVASNSVLTIDSISNVIASQLYVFAASSQRGEGNLIVNDETFTDIWNGTSNSTDMYVVDLSAVPSLSNSVSFVATGSTIVALQQFIIVESVAPKSASDLQKLIDDAEPGDIIDLGNDIYEDISNVNITKDITITGGTIIGTESADPIFVIAPKSEGGPENVNISGVDFKVNNANVIVKATADNATNPTSIDVANINIEGNTIEAANENVVPESVTVLKLESERGILAPTGEISINGNTIEAGVNPFEFDVTTVTSGSDVNIPEGGDLPEKLATVIEYEDMNTTAIDSSIEPGTGKYFEITLRDSNGVALANKDVQFGFNGKIYNKTTDENGIAKLQINLQRADIYTFAVSFQGDDAYNGSFAVAKITVKKQTPTLTVPNKSYKASAKTKTLIATFKSASGKVVANKKVTFTVNGKTYTATTNDKGVASVNVSLSDKKTYSFTAKFAGDNTYAAITKTAKVTIS